MSIENFYQFLASRRSIRSFAEKRVPREILERIGGTVGNAPTACNRQPCRVVIATGDEMLNRIRAACPQQLFKTAPAIAAVICDTNVAWKRPEGDTIAPVDAAIVMEHLILAATAEGLGSCWVCAYPMAKVNAALNVKPGEHVYALTPLGYPAEAASAIHHKPLSELLTIIE